MHRAIAALCFVCWAFAAGPLMARVIYVNNDGGDDRFDGGSQFHARQGSGPCRTIAKALRVAKAGDRIVLVKTGQPYRESVLLTGKRHSAFLNTPLTIEGNGAILDGTRPVPDNWRHVAGQVFRYRPPRFSHQMLYLDGKPAERVKVTGPDVPKLAAKQWCHFKGEIYFAAEPGRIPSDYDLRHTHLRVGVGLYMCHGVVISNLTVQGFQIDGINAHDNVRDITLGGLTLRGNARAGLSVGGASRVRLEACLVGNNGDAQVRTEGFCKLEVVDCDLLDNTAPPIVKEGGKVIVKTTPPPAAARE